MKPLLAYLGSIWPFWVVPLAGFFGFLIWLAVQVAGTPENPFIYRF